MSPWPWGFTPWLHRHQWDVRRGLTVPMFDPAAKGELWRCTVPDCQKVVAR